jgi:hypothetical protein
MGKRALSLNNLVSLDDLVIIKNGFERFVKVALRAQP